MSMEKMEKLLTIEDLAEVMGISPKSLRRNITVYPDRVPPFLRTAPGSNGHIRFRPEVVREWFRIMEDHVQRHRTPGSPAAERCGNISRRRAGRPTKAESVAKKHEEAFPSGHKTQPLPWGGTS